MRLKLVGTGLDIFGTTSIVNAETGETIEHVRSVSFRQVAGEHPTLIIEVVPTEVEIEAEGEVEIESTDQSETRPIDPVSVECRCGKTRGRTVVLKADLESGTWSERMCLRCGDHRWVQISIS